MGNNNDNNKRIIFTVQSIRPQFHVYTFRIISLHHKAVGGISRHQPSGDCMAIANSIGRLGLINPISNRPFQTHTLTSTSSNIYNIIRIVIESSSTCSFPPVPAEHHLHGSFHLTSIPYVFVSKICCLDSLWFQNQIEPTTTLNVIPKKKKKKNKNKQALKN